MIEFKISYLPSYAVASSFTNQVFEYSTYMLEAIPVQGMTNFRQF